MSLTQGPSKTLKRRLRTRIKPLVFAFEALNEVFEAFKGDDKISALEDKTQQVAVRLRSSISIFKDTFGETVARLQIWF